MKTLGGNGGKDKLREQHPIQRGDERDRHSAHHSSNVRSLGTGASQHEDKPNHRSNHAKGRGGLAHEFQQVDLFEGSVVVHLDLGPNDLLNHLL